MDGTRTTGRRCSWRRYQARGELVEALLDAGADVNTAAPDGSTPLMKATLWRHVDIVRVLLAHGADATAADDRGWTALSIARLLNQPGLIQLLEQHT